MKKQILSKNFIRFFIRNIYKFKEIGVKEEEQYNYGQQHHDNNRNSQGCSSNS